MAAAVVPIQVLTATPAAAAPAFSNAAIADRALTYEGFTDANHPRKGWGGNACKDAGKLDNRNTGSTVGGYGAGQCRTFVNCILFLVSGGATYPVGSDYFTSLTNAGGQPVADLDHLVKGDIIQDGQGIHTYIIVKRNSGNSFHVVDSNYYGDETVHQHDLPITLDSNNRAYRFGSTYLNHIVKWQDDPNRDANGEPITAWFVISDASGNLRRQWIPNGLVYGCLRAGGAPVDKLPSDVLNTMPDMSGVSARCDNPFGRLDSVTPVGPGKVRVAGWTADSNNPGTYLDVHIYSSGGGFEAGFPSGGYRPDVNTAYPGYGNYHGFEKVINLKLGGSQQICAYGLNIGPGANSQLGCVTVSTADPQPFGNLDRVTRVSNGIRVQGWAADPNDLSRSVDVHIYLNGGFATGATANTLRPDVNGYRGVQGNYHGFDTTISGTSGPAQVCAYAINFDAGSVNTPLGCLNA